MTPSEDAPHGVDYPAGRRLTAAETRVHVGGDPLAPPTRFQRGFYALVATIVMGATRIWFRARVEGLEHVPAERPFILAPVHRSNIDFALTVGVTGRRRMRYLAKDTIWKGFFGRIWTALGAIPVHRGSADREALTTCIGVLEAGEPLVMFPEGTRQSGPVVADLFDGVAFVQARSGVPIVPMGIGGSERAMPIGARFPRPSRVVIRLGPPLEAPEPGARGRVARSAIHGRTAELRSVLQDLLDECDAAAGVRRNHSPGGVSGP